MFIYFPYFIWSILPYLVYLWYFSFCVCLSVIFSFLVSYVWFFLICFLFYYYVIFNMLCVLFYLSAWCIFRIRIKALLINSLIKYGLAMHNGERPTCWAIPMHVSKWPKRPNLVPGPKLGGNSIFSPSTQSTLSQGVLPTRKPLITGACAHSTLILFIPKGDWPYWNGLPMQISDNIALCTLNLHRRESW